jgi:hypothetical protein
MKRFPAKDPAAVKDYKWDWSDWLDGDTIATHTVTAEDGITKDSSSITDDSTSVTVWISGGTAGSEYQITCQIVTTGGRTDGRTAIFSIRNQ